MADIVDLDLLLQAEAHKTGPLWGVATADLNATLLVWKEGEAVASHINDEVDVVMVVLRGQAELILDGVPHQLGQGHVAVLPKGAARSVSAMSAELAYINVHRRRTLNLQSSRPKNVTG